MFGILPHETFSKNYYGCSFDRYRTTLNMINNMFDNKNISVIHFSYAVCRTITLIPKVGLNETFFRD